MQSMLEDWNQQAEHFFYSGSGDFTDTGEFQIEEYNENGAAIATYTARVIIN